MPTPAVLGATRLRAAAPPKARASRGQGGEPLSRALNLDSVINLHFNIWKEFRQLGS